MFESSSAATRPSAGQATAAPPPSSAPSKKVDGELLGDCTRTHRAAVLRKPLDLAQPSDATRTLTGSGAQ
jgi:hypothetical protein